MLAHVPGMKVAGRTSSFFFRGKDVEFAEIGRRLNVEAYSRRQRAPPATAYASPHSSSRSPTGSISGRNVTTARRSIFTIQDEITQAIAEALLIKLLSEGDALRRHAPDLRAYEAYLAKAREQWFKGTPQALAKLKEFIDRAIELDPHSRSPVCWEDTTPCWRTSASLTRARSSPGARGGAGGAAHRSFAAEARALLAVCHGMDYEWNEAERHWRCPGARTRVARSSPLVRKPLPAAALPPGRGRRSDGARSPRGSPESFVSPPLRGRPTPPGQT